MILLTLRRERKKGNANGKNPQHKRAWLWVALTPLVSPFKVMLARSTAGAQSLLGENFGGILNCYRYSAYNWLDVEQRQICWAHLKREFTKISQRSGVSHQLGTDLLAQQKKLFPLWHRVRDGTLSRTQFQSLVLPIRERLRNLLELRSGNSCATLFKASSPLLSEDAFKLGLPKSYSPLSTIFLSISILQFKCRTA
ncbi:MAG: transposase [Moorea sp. SIO2B7]|nr:transposase [Moorena sp. SIO2B7]